MNTEERKEYNKKYYAEKKDDIKMKMNVKEQCPLCKRYVKHQFMNRHQSTGICKRGRDNCFIGDIINLKAEIEILKQRNNIVYKKDELLREK